MSDGCQPEFRLTDAEYRRLCEKQGALQRRITREFGKDAGYTYVHTRDGEHVFWKHLPLDTG